MSFQFKRGFSGGHAEMGALSNVSFSIKGADGDREERVREVGGGDKRELLSVS